MKKAVIVLFWWIIFSGTYFLGGRTRGIPSFVTILNYKSKFNYKIAVGRDADDLADWEETFGVPSRWKDTDTDGADDGTEVAVGRSPLVTGPNDKSPTLPSVCSFKRNAVETKILYFFAQTRWANYAHSSHRSQN